jgi:hypothetical protein
VGDSSRRGTRKTERERLTPAAREERRRAVAWVAWVRRCGVVVMSEGAIFGAWKVLLWFGCGGVVVGLFELCW